MTFLILTPVAMSPPLGDIGVYHASAISGLMVPMDFTTNALCTSVIADLAPAAAAAGACNAGATR